TARSSTCCSAWSTTPPTKAPTSATRAWRCSRPGSRWTRARWSSARPSRRPPTARSRAARRKRRKRKRRRAKPSPRSMGLFEFIGVKKKELTLEQVKREEIKLGIRETQTLAKLEKLEKEREDIFAKGLKIKSPP